MYYGEERCLFCAELGGFLALHVVSRLVNRHQEVQTMTSTRQARGRRHSHGWSCESSKRRSGVCKVRLSSLLEYRQAVDMIDILSKDRRYRVSYESLWKEGSAAG
jgi:hypothetical protein